MANNKINIFTFLNQIFYKNAKVPYDKKVASAYILALWLSHDPELVHIVNRINPYIFSLKDDQIYKYFFYNVPKKRRFIKWIKKDSKKESKEVKEEMEHLRERLGISKVEASKYRKLVEEEYGK